MKFSNNELFNQKSISTKIFIKEECYDIHNIINSLTDIEIIDTELIDANKGVSYEGYRMTGKKILINFLLKGKITYTSSYCGKNIYITKFSSFKTMDIVLPEFYLDKNINSLYRENRISIKPNVEGSYSRIINPREIYNSTVILIEASICT